jgi:hypothetical protein
MCYMSSQRWKCKFFHELNTELERNLNTTHGLRGHLRSLRWRSCQSFTCWLSNSVLGSEVACSRSNTLSRCWWVVQPATSLILHAEPTVCLVVEPVGWVDSDLLFFWDDSNPSHVWLQRLDWVRSNLFFCLDGEIATDRFNSVTAWLGCTFHQEP